jgi:hypothetical protein
LSGAIQIFDFETLTNPEYPILVPVNANQLFYWRKLYQAGRLGASDVAQDCRFGIGTAFDVHLRMAQFDVNPARPCGSPTRRLQARLCN